MQDDTEYLTPEELASLKKEMEEDLGYCRKVFRGQKPIPSEANRPGKAR